MNQIIGSGNKISFDLSFQPLMDSHYLRLSTIDHTYIRRQLLIDSNKDVFIKLLCDVLIKNITVSIEKRTGNKIPHYMIEASGKLDDKDEFLTITFKTPQGITHELLNTILKEEFKDEPNINLTRRILHLF